MAYVTDIYPIPDERAAVLFEAGIRTQMDLLERCSSPANRNTVARQTGIPAQTLARWAHCADLCRIRGMNHHVFELLWDVGVKSMYQLAHANPHTLAAQLLVVNQKRRILNNPPDEMRVGDWISQAQQLPILVSD